MKELLEEFLGKKIRSFIYREGVFGNREPHYQCVLEDYTNATVGTSNLLGFIYKLASRKFPKTLEMMDNDFNRFTDSSKEIWYRLTSNTAIYHNGESIIFNTGFKFRLAGFELSKHTNYSPFHYNDDIIRLPNSIVKKIENEH